VDRRQLDEIVERLFPTEKHVNEWPQEARLFYANMLSFVWGIMAGSNEVHDPVIEKKLQELKQKQTTKIDLELAERLERVGAEFETPEDLIAKGDDEVGSSGPSTAGG
jgi:hypothetical protein